MGMAEIDTDTELLLQPLMLKKENVVVEGDGLHLRISLLHAQERTLHVPDRDRQYSLQEILPHLAVAEGKDDAASALARDDEIALHMAEAPTLVDFARSCIDHALPLDALLRAVVASFLLEYLRPMRLDASSIRTLDISADGRGRDVCEMLLDPFQPLCDLFRRLIIEQVRLHECS